MPKKDRVNATAKQLRRLWEEQDGVCAISGLPYTLENVQVDHIFPCEKGGDHSIENLHLVLNEINRMKGTLTMERFLELCHAVVRNSQIKEYSEI